MEIITPFSLFATQSDSVTLRVTVLDSPPQGTVSINNNADYTNSTTVTLNLSATDLESSVAQMKFSNDNTNWSGPINYTSTAAWALAAGDGTKTVWAKFKDAAGNWSSAEIKDSIVLDTTAPVITSISPIDGAKFQDVTSILVFVNINDTDASPVEYQFSIDQEIKQGWSAQSTYNWLNPLAGRHSIKIEVRDAGGQAVSEADICVLRVPLAAPQ
jgi:hypothetical protein